MATFRKGNSAHAILTRDITVGTTATSHTTSVKVTWFVSAADSITLRGIPAIGRGVAGHIHGTRPDSTNP